jgi:hypothetical protein
VSYSNFRDPAGLARRMVTSGQAPARWSLGLAALAALSTPVDLWWGRHEDELLQAATSRIDQPLVFVVGCSRSGTTLAYQLLTRTTQVSYFTNLASLFRRSPITASRRFAPYLHRPKGQSSYFGQTAGFSGANDGFAVWDRWLGIDRYRPEEPDDRAVAGMRAFFAAWTTAFPRPLVNKNNRNALAIRWLASALPEARFVVVRRDRRATVRSLLGAREHVQGSVDHAWGLAAADVGASDDPLRHVDVTYQQVAVVDAALDEQLAGLAADRFVDVRYEALCGDPGAFVECVAELGGLRLVEEGMPRLSPLRVSTGKPRSAAEEKRLERLLSNGISPTTNS